MNIPTIDEFRPIPFYFLTTCSEDAMSLEAAREAMRKVKDAGFGGVIYFNKPPLGFSRKQFLEDYWFECVGHFIQAAREEKLQFWINDGFDFPPGDAGDKIREANPELGQMRLHRKEDGSVDFVEVPWGFPAFEYEESSRLFIKFGYEEYKRRFGKFFGDGITGFFSDCDNRRVNYRTKALIDGEDYYPWSRDFPELFMRKHNYDIVPRLPDLMEGKDAQLNSDYWGLMSDLYQNWFRNNYEWCKANGLKYSFHTSDTGPMSRRECYRSSCFSEGCTLSMLKHSDWPGTDHELAVLDSGIHTDQRMVLPIVIVGSKEPPYYPHFARTKFDLRAKYTSSATFLYGRERALCEMFAATNWCADTNLLRKIAAWQILQGITQIVPHAVHHRFLGPAKMFAPPEFTYGNMRHGLRQFNDELAKYCLIASQGKYVAPIGVLDTMPDIIAGKCDGTAIRELCDELNRQSIGYVITDLAHAGEFQLLLEPGKPYSLPPQVATFDGGQLAWMHRRLENGTEFIMAANLWADHELSGTAKFNGKEYHIALVPGEIAVLGGPYEDYRRPIACDYGNPLPLLNAASPEEENIVPLFCIREWTITSPLEALRLLVPVELAGKVSVDGKALVQGVPCKVFDDQYMSYDLDASLGRHSISCDEKVTFATPLLLQGKFAADFTGYGKGEALCSYYNQSIYAPATCSLALSCERPLGLGDWTLQGRPFYSGGVTYELGLEGKGEDIALELFTDGICSVSLDGVEVQKLLWPPYRLTLKNLASGSHVLKVTVWNSFANRMDGLALKSGLESVRPIVNWK